MHTLQLKEYLHKCILGNITKNVQNSREEGISLMALARVVRQPLTMASIERDWSGCRKCAIGSKCQHHVFWGFVGDVVFTKADIVIIGEGPGKVEDVRGETFRGPAGKLLRQAIEDAGPQCLYCDGEGSVVDEESKDIRLEMMYGAGIFMLPLKTCPKCAGYGSTRICLLNLLVCRPYAGKPQGAGNRPPTVGEAMNCLPRLVDSIQVLNPAIIVAAGKEAADFLPLIRERLNNDRGMFCYACKITHPSAIARNGGVKSPLYPKYVESIREILKFNKEVKQKGYYSG